MASFLLFHLSSKRGRCAARQADDHRNRKFHDVAIVGFGPSGAIAAGLLGQAGIRTFVCDRNEEVYDKPRALALDHEILRRIPASRHCRQGRALAGALPGRRISGRGRAAHQEIYYGRASLSAVLPTFCRLHAASRGAHPARDGRLFALHRRDARLEAREPRSDRSGRHAGPCRSAGAKAAHNRALPDRLRRCREYGQGLDRR